MDAQSLHNHNIPSSAKQRIHAKTVDEPETSDKIFENEEETKVEPEKVESDKEEPEKEEFDRDGDGVVSLMEELNTAEDAKMSAEEATAEIESKSEEEDVPEPEKEDDDLPKAEILTMNEEKHPGFNAFSSAHASSPMPQQNHQAPVEEAKPVKDNTNAIIMILLIAILLIAVAIFGVIVLSQYKNDHTVSTSTETGRTDPEGDEDDTKKGTQYDFSAIIGNWTAASNDNKCLNIKEDGEVSWYTVCDNTEKDHYAGKAKIIRGQDAIDLLGITKERATRKVGLSSDEVSLSNIYVLSIEPTEYVLAGEQIAKPEKINILFIYTKDDEAQAYDYNYGDIYVLKRTVEDNGDLS